jgi:hypothetical protein
MGNPFLFADRFSGAVVHLTTACPALRDAPSVTSDKLYCFTAIKSDSEMQNARDSKLRRHFLFKS